MFSVFLFLFLFPVMQKITSLWRKEAEHLQTGLWKKKIVTTAWWTMERGWMASSMRMAPLLDNTVVRKRKNQPRETRAQRPLHLSTPWTPLFKSLGSVAMSHFSGLSFLGSSHPSQPMDLWVERMFSAVCEYYESKARTQLSHVIMWTGVQRAYLSLFRVGFSRFPWNWLKKKSNPTPSTAHIIPRVGYSSISCMKHTAWRTHRGYAGDMVRYLVTLSSADP